MITKIAEASPNRNLMLDGWRGLAILAVLQAHFLPIHSIHSGAFGVNVFFVLSGLLMSNILFVKKTPLGLFYKRRISRIFPVFFIYVSVIYLYAFFIGSQEYKNYFYTLGFLRSYMPFGTAFWDMENPVPINHVWSLNVEEHSYIFLSIISVIGFMKNRAHIPLLLTGFLCFTICYYYGVNPPNLSGPFVYQTEIAASSLVISAGYFLIRDNFTKYVKSWMPLTAFILALACFETTLKWYFPMIFSPLLLAFSVNHIQEMPAFIKNILHNKVLIKFGIWSFSIYLWQQIFYFYGDANGIFKADNYFMMSCLLSVSIFAGVISYYAIEQPSRKYLNNNW